MLKHRLDSPEASARHHRRLLPRSRRLRLIHQPEPAPPHSLHSPPGKPASPASTVKIIATIRTETLDIIPPDVPTHAFTIRLTSRTEVSDVFHKLRSDSREPALSLPKGRLSQHDQGR